jgi:hypothetical protein
VLQNIICHSSCHLSDDVVLGSDMCHSFPHFLSPQPPAFVTKFREKEK